MIVTSEAVADETQFDANCCYFDEKATKEKPIWWMVC